MKKLILGLTILFGASTLMAQKNLVPNPSFERTVKKPKKGVNEMLLAEPWFSPDEEIAPDMYSKQIKKEHGIPENKYGHQNAEAGQNYIGLRAYGYKEKLPRTFAEVKLFDALTEGKSYCVSFNIALSKISKYASRNIGAYLTEKKVRMKDIESWTITPQIMNSRNVIHEDQYLWITVCGIYKAQGGERYITIGNFQDQEDMDRNKENTKRMKRPKGYTQLQTYDAYYFLDDVKVINMDELEGCSCEKSDDEDFEVVYSENVSEELDMTVAGELELKKVFFDEDSDITNSPTALIEVIRILKENENLKVEVVGHMDKTESRNTADISLRRAEKIREYLVSKGIDESRLSVRDARILEMVDESGTKAGNAQNRRVTFKVTAE
jgi:outer membrane protein OmpA-like peptidoglycan-associated protein